MKHKTAVLIALCAAMLSACNAGTADTVTDISGTEISETEALTTRDTIIKGFEDGYEPGAGIAGDTIVNVPEDETAADSVSGKEEITYRIIESLSDKQENIRFVKDGIICSYDWSEESVTVNFTDLDSGEIINSITLPEGIDTADELYAGVGDVLAVCLNEYFDHDAMQLRSRAVKIYSDNSTEMIDDPLPSDMAFESGGHTFAHVGIDLCCLDSGKPEVIVPGSTKEDDESGFYTRSVLHRFPIDENRFVYRILGYESIPGFGIYDFSSGTYKEVPDSQDLLPLGTKGGMIYSVRTEWDGFGTNIYITDADTLETTFFMDFPYALDMNMIVNYVMPESGDYIAAICESANDLYIYKIDTETKEISAECELPKEGASYSGMGIFYKNTLIYSSQYDKTVAVKFPDR